jgi:hypothetical protein
MSTVLLHVTLSLPALGAGMLVAGPASLLGIPRALPRAATIVSSFHPLGLSAGGR